MSIHMRRVFSKLYGVSVAAIAALLLWGGAATEAVTLTMIAETRDTHLAWQKEIVEAFQKLHPDIRVELVDTAGVGLVPKMQAMLAGGVPLDIGYMDPWLVVEWGKTGVLADLTPYIEREREHFAAWPEQVFAFYQAGNGMYGIPQDLQIGGMFFNIDMFESAGVPLPNSEWSYADLEEMSRRLRIVGPDGAVTRWGLRLPASRNWVPVIWAFGGDLVDDWSDPTRFTGNTTETADALRYLQNLVTIGAAQDRVSNSRIPFAQAFPAQHVGIIQSNTISMAAFYSITDFAWDVAPLPKGPAGRAGFINAIGWFLFESSDHKAEAWELLKFMTSLEALARRVEITGNMPPSLDVMTSVWLPGLERPASRHVLLDEISHARSPWPLNGNLFDVMNNEAFKAIWGQQPVEAAIETMDRQVNAMLQQARAAQ